jgi:signal transduction histidine kinase
VVVVLDDSVIRERILPDLATKYFPEGDYKVSVVDEREQAVFATQAVTEPDVRIPIFSMAPDNLVFFGKHAAMQRTPGEKRSDVVINQRVESHTLSRFESSETAKGGQVFEFKMKEAAGDSLPRISTMTGTTGSPSEPWMLQVQHTAGSIDAFVANEENKSLMIGLGIYLLLVGAIVAIILSAMRSKRFAQRQIDFVSSVSHEFRTPLAVIYSAGENLADGVAKEDAQVARYGKLIKGEGKNWRGWSSKFWSLPARIPGKGISISLRPMFAILSVMR